MCFIIRRDYRSWNLVRLLLKYEVTVKLEYALITKEKEEEALALRVLQDQEGYIESVEDCLREARELEVWVPLGIYFEGKMIGFAMYGFFAEEPPNGRLWMDRFLIDKAYQGRGFGYFALTDLLQRLWEEYQKTEVYLSVVEETIPAVALYQKMGFAWTGEEDEKGEKIMVYQYKKIPCVKEKLEQQLQFLKETDKMKNVERQTLLVDQSRRETDAEHSWHFALMAMTLFEHVGIKGVNLDRVIRMALVHDLVEIYAGDTYAYDVKGYENKEEKEKEAADQLFSLLSLEQANEYRSLWEEFDQMETPDALYAAAVDRFQPFFNNFLTEGHTWIQHKVSAAQVYKRMEPVKLALPALWKFVEFVIEDSCKKGYLIH